VLLSINRHDLTGGHQKLLHREIRRRGRTCRVFAYLILSAQVLDCRRRRTRGDEMIARRHSLRYSPLIHIYPREITPITPADENY